MVADLAPPLYTESAMGMCGIILHCPNFSGTLNTASTDNVNCIHGRRLSAGAGDVNQACLPAQRPFRHDQLLMSMGNCSVLRLTVRCMRHASQ